MAIEIVKIPMKHGDFPGYVSLPGRVMWVKQCHEPPLGMVTIPPTKMVMTGEWLLLYRMPFQQNMRSSFFQLRVPLVIIQLLDWDFP